MADPLSVAASVAGLLSAAGYIAKVHGPSIAAARDTPKIWAEVNSVVQATIILSAFQKLANSMASIPARHAALVRLDQLVAALTNGVLIFSELEVSVGSLPLAEPSITRLALRTRLQWARKETELADLVTRLQGFKLSISRILTTLQKTCRQSRHLRLATITRLMETPTHRPIRVKGGLASTTGGEQQRTTPSLDKPRGRL